MKTFQKREGRQLVAEARPPERQVRDQRVLKTTAHWIARDVGRPAVYGLTGRRPAALEL